METLIENDDSLRFERVHEKFFFCFLISKKMFESLRDPNFWLPLQIGT